MTGDTEGLARRRRRRSGTAPSTHRRPTTTPSRATASLQPPAAKSHRTRLSVIANTSNVARLHRPHRGRRHPRHLTDFPTQRAVEAAGRVIGVPVVVLATRSE